LCNPRVRTERSPFFIEQFLANDEDDRADIATPPTCENTKARKGWYRCSSTDLPQKEPRAGLCVGHKRSGSEPLTSIEKIDHLNMFDKDFWRSERAADIRMKNLLADTMSQVRSIISLADSIQQSEDYINDELKRHEKVIKTSNSILNEAKADINSIDGFTVVSGKVKAFLHTKKTAPIYLSDNPNLEFKWNRPRRYSGPVVLPSEVSIHSVRLKNSINILCGKLDRIEMDALNIKEQLEYQEPDLDELDKNVEHVNEEIKDRTDLIYRRLGQLKQ